eukprot:TRINITY_DN2533_c0_g1::TRINITY_DN2533_c0_g1_i1::g.19279::m.19279 TRINITY_DN2533_c0_g1::TRINITY_DN2533_c0_g1_i1::g.19279  ORF type:complete len:423 (-),score=61.41,DUF4191/PF13829.1/1.5e+03,DUF4191/PF13829.1/0.2,DUF1469/PF07332.6/83,DUF1469/PF07332.6/33,DUF1469/PF07332.6/1.5e+02 TRINITY_DN2533_c0_g1_i1:76-1257(-)
MAIIANAPNSDTSSSSSSNANSSNELTLLVSLLFPWKICSMPVTPDQILTLIMASLTASLYIALFLLAITAVPLALGAAFFCNIALRKCSDSYNSPLNARLRYDFSCYVSFVAGGIWVISWGTGGNLCAVGSSDDHICSMLPFMSWLVVELPCLGFVFLYVLAANFCRQSLVLNGEPSESTSVPGDQPAVQLVSSNSEQRNSDCGWSSIPFFLFPFGIPCRLSLPTPDLAATRLMLVFSGCVYLFCIFLFFAVVTSGPSAMRIVLVTGLVVGMNLAMRMLSRAFQSPIYGRLQSDLYYHAAISLTCIWFVVLISAEENCDAKEEDDRYMCGLATFLVLVFMALPAYVLSLLYVLLADYLRKKSPPPVDTASDRPQLAVTTIPQYIQLENFENI